MSNKLTRIWVATFYSLHNQLSRFMGRTDEFFTFWIPSYVQTFNGWFLWFIVEVSIISVDWKSCSKKQRKSCRHQRNNNYFIFDILFLIFKMWSIRAFTVNQQTKNLSWWNKFLAQTHREVENEPRI